MRKDYLSCYGGQKFLTKNVDKIAEQGTKFERFYTAAASSAMAYTSMFSGLDTYEVERGLFGEEDKFEQVDTLFDLLESDGYTTHIVWDKKWYGSSRKKSMVFSDKTTFHNLDIAQHVGPHSVYARDADGKIIPRTDVNPVEDVLQEVSEIISKCDNYFLWIHLPHVLAGRTGYGSDIDLFDEIVGKVMELHNGELFITSDHGNMDGEKAIPCYGHHLYEGTICIPLITTMKFDEKYVKTPFSNKQIINLIRHKRIDDQKYVFSDTRYYLQPDRKLAIISDEFKYIYNKIDRTEELYDLSLDPTEERNLLLEKIIDIDRFAEYFFEEVVYYPKWSLAESKYFELKEQRIRAWKKGGYLVELLVKLKERKSKGIVRILLYKLRNKVKVKGRWGSMAKANLYRK